MNITVPAPLLPSSDRSYNLLQSYRLLPYVRRQIWRVSTHCLIVSEARGAAMHQPAPDADPAIQHCHVYSPRRGHSCCVFMADEYENCCCPGPSKCPLYSQLLALMGLAQHCLFTNSSDGGGKSRRAMLAYIYTFIAFILVQNHCASRCPYRPQSNHYT